MAKVEGCNLALIDRLGPELDFYYWKGILCCRMMPRKVKQPGTPEQRKTWECLQYANDEYNSLGQQARDCFIRLAAPSQMTGRDLFIKSILNYCSELGFHHARIGIGFLPNPWGTVQLRLVKQPNCKVRLMGMNQGNLWLALYWKEITPTLRGKKMLRRWELIEQPQYASRVEIIPAYLDHWETIFWQEAGPHFWTASVIPGFGVGYGRSGLYYF